MKFQDIQVSDLELKATFAKFWLESKYESAIKLLKDNPQLKTKAFVADSINLAVRAILVLEEKYNTDFINVLSLKLSSFDNVISNFVDKGKWNGSDTYYPGNIVSYDKNITVPGVIDDNLFLCIAENRDIPPDKPFTEIDEEHWLFLGLIGNKGPEFFRDREDVYDGRWRYEWNSKDSYRSGDIVTYEDYLWMCIAGTSGGGYDGPPSTTPLKWTKFLKLPKVSVIVSEAKPVELYEGLIWFEIVDSTETNSYNINIKKYNQKSNDFDILYPVTNIKNIKDFYSPPCPEVIVSTTSKYLIASRGAEEITRPTVDGKCIIPLTDYGLWNIRNPSNTQNKNINIYEIKQYHINLD